MNYLVLKVLNIDWWVLKNLMKKKSYKKEKILNLNLKIDIVIINKKLWDNNFNLILHHKISIFLVVIIHKICKVQTVNFNLDRDHKLLIDKLMIISYKN